MTLIFSHLLRFFFLLVGRFLLRGRLGREPTGLRVLRLFVTTVLPQC